MESKATWIWFPGDFEVWLGNRFNNRRTERGAMFPPIWKQDSHWPTVVFTRDVDLPEAETVNIAAEGHYNLAIDGHLQAPGPCTIPAGRHTLALKVWNQATPPALYIDGPTVKTDSTWLTTCEDKIWIDEHGMAHGSGIYVPAASWCFDSADCPPSLYRLPTTPLRPVGSEAVSATARLYDFGREVFGFLRLHGLQGTARIYYGESREEALDTARCETLDTLNTGGTLGSKAFRHVCIETLADSTYADVTMDFEYAPSDPSRCASFSCSDDELNRIWRVAAYTLELTTREFFCDGIKRDRWTWSGDAIQSYLMNYYLHFDTECVKRTIRQLRGKDPVTAHINTIMDYTFYWFKSIADYYAYTADRAFLAEMWPKMVSLMDYVLGRVNADGMAEGRADDWIFVDWTDFPMHKRGTLAFEQILLWKALETMRAIADLLGTNWHMTSKRVEALRQNIDKTFWDGGHHAYLHAIEDGQLNPQVTKFPNIFAIIYDFAADAEKAMIANHVLLNPDVPAITTPYMRFYELEALCQTGHHADVLHQLKSYWGGMLRLGATTFWEKYNPDETGTQHLAMYGRPYGKSLCHAWGASPLYIIGKYMLGVRPTQPGYAQYEVRPTLAGLQWMKGDVPTPFGLIHVELDGTRCTVSSDGGRGTLIVGDRQIEIPPKQTIHTDLQ